MTLRSRLASATSAALLVLAGAPHLAHADVKGACIEAAESVADLRAAGRFAAARGKLASCMASACPSIVRNDCTKALADLDAAQPTVVFEARRGGEDVTGVVVREGQTTVGDTSATTGVEVDPGTHTFRFEHPGDAPVDVELAIREGDKLRRVRAELPVSSSASTSTTATTTAQGTTVIPADAPSGERRPFVVPGATWVAGAVAVVSFAGFAYFGLRGRHDVAALRDGCAPDCNPDDVSAARRKLLIGDVALGVGVVATGVAVWQLVVANHAPEREAASTSPRLLIGGGPGALVVGFAGALD